MMLCIKNNCTLIHQYVFFFIRVVGIDKTFRLKLIIQGLLQSYNRDMSFNLTKTKTLLITLIGINASNIGSLTIHLTLNISIQQSLSSLPKLSSNSLNRLTCQYEQLQVVVIYEISLVGVRMFKVIDNRLRSIKHIQKQFFWWC
jgi:hypothetical protein